MAQRPEMLQPEQTNRSLQRRMAECLLDAGLDEAIEFAGLNGWQGVLSELSEFAPAHHTAEPGRPIVGMRERWK